jgi:predicted transcriptional regulator
MKSVLISIKPKWVEKIASGEKTIEVRKTRPKLETPFKCYIYCTLDGGMKGDRLMPSGITCGKVIGEFICNHILHSNENAFIGEKPLTQFVLKQSCLTMEELNDYRSNKNIYAWEIRNLKIYDKPKELSEFWTIKCTNKRNGCQGCKVKPNCIKTITRPFQSWGYVESLGE